MSRGHLLSHFRRIFLKLRTVRKLQYGDFTEFPDGQHKASIAANNIVENLFAQVDTKGNRFALLDDVIDYQTSGTQVAKEDGFVITSTGTK